MREKIRKSLEKQLRDKGLKVSADAYLFDLVHDYLKLYDTKEALQRDIEERGVMVYWQNSEESYGYKKNDSVDNLNRVNAQMLKILQYLNLRPPEEKEDSGGGEVDVPKRL